MLAISLPAMRLMAVDTDSKDQAANDKGDKDKDKADKGNLNNFQPEQQNSKGSVNVEGTRSGTTRSRHAGGACKGWDDVPQNADKDAKEGPGEASMFYVATSRTTAKGAPRPLTSSLTADRDLPRCGCTWRVWAAAGVDRR